jgi:hypothetical protein
MASNNLEEDVHMPIQMYYLGFAHQVQNKLEELAQKHCYGCEIAHPSQTQHSFLMCSEMEHSHMYGDQAYQDVIENDTITIWLDVIYPATSLWEEMTYVLACERLLRDYLRPCL